MQAIPDTTGVGEARWTGRQKAARDARAGRGRGHARLLGGQECDPHAGCPGRSMLTRTRADLLITVLRQPGGGSHDVRAAAATPAERLRDGASALRDGHRFAGHRTWSALRRGSGFGERAPVRARDARRWSTTRPPLTLEWRKATWERRNAVERVDVNSIKLRPARGDSYAVRSRQRLPWRCRCGGRAVGSQAQADRWTVGNVGERVRRRGRSLEGDGAGGRGSARLITRGPASIPRAPRQSGA